MEEGLRVFSVVRAPCSARPPPQQLQPSAAGLVRSFLSSLMGSGNSLYSSTSVSWAGREVMTPGQGRTPQRRGRASRTGDEEQADALCPQAPALGASASARQSHGLGPRPSPPRARPARLSLDPSLLLSLPGLQESAFPRLHTQGLPGTTPSPRGPRDRDWGHFTGTRAELTCSQRGAASCFLGKKIHLSLRHEHARSRSSREPAPITVLATPRTARIVKRSLPEGRVPAACSAHSSAPPGPSQPGGERLQQQWPIPPAAPRPERRSSAFCLNGGLSRGQVRWPLD